MRGERAELDEKAARIDELLAAAGGHDVGPGVGEPVGERPPDTGRSADDDRRPARQR